MNMKHVIILLFLLPLWIACDQMPFRNPTTEEQEAQHNFEQTCKFDSIGKMTLAEQRLNDSMVDKKFEYAKIEHVYHFWRCRGQNRLTHKEFFFRYKRKRPVPLSLQTKSEDYLTEIATRVFKNYISNEDIMKYDEFQVIDDFFGTHRTISRDSIFSLCGFKVIKDSKNKYKRTTI